MFRKIIMIFLRTCYFNSLKILKYKRQNVSFCQNQRCYSTIKLPVCKLVVFDKDGTLIDCNAMWRHWSVDYAEKLEKATGLPLRDYVYEVMKYDPVTKILKKGGFSEKTNPDLQTDMQNVLQQKYNMSEEKSRQIVVDNWKHSFESENVDINEQVVPLGNVKNIFGNLDKNGIKVAVCTSDSRVGAELTLKTLDVFQHVSRLICGNDPDSVSKPAPENVWKICKELDISTENTAVLGDMPADVQMGLSSGAGAIIAIESDVCIYDDLKGAHHIVKNIDEAMQILFPDIFN